MAFPSLVEKNVRSRAFQPAAGRSARCRRGFFVALRDVGTSASVCQASKTGIISALVPVDHEAPFLEAVLDSESPRRRPATRPIAWVLWASIIAAVWLGGDSALRDAIQTWLRVKVIAGLVQVDPLLIAKRIWSDTLHCRPSTIPPYSRCENLLGQVVRLPGALVDTAGYVWGTGWPGIVIGVLSLILMVPMMGDNPLTWPFALLLGVGVAGLCLWVLRWSLVGVAWSLVGALVLIGSVSGFIEWGDRLWRVEEIRRRVLGGEHGPTHGVPEAGREGRSRR